MIDTNNGLFICGNGYQTLTDTLELIYGERGSAKHNLERHFDSDEYHSGCHYANSIEQIPELTEDLLWQCVDRHELFQRYAKKTQEQYDALLAQGKMTHSEYEVVAGIMGIAPGQTDRVDTLFPHLLDLYVSSEEEAEEVYCCVRDNPKPLELLVDRMMDSIRDGQIFEYNGHRICSQGYARFYYRGENAYNVRSIASLFRGRSRDPQKAEIQDLIAETKICDFSIWLKQLDCVNQWPLGDVFHGAVAQHYGIATNGLDVTSDLKVALFFACCTIDKESGQWRPLRANEFSTADSRPEVAKRGGDSRYGILFSAPADLCELSHAAQLQSPHFTNITPIGYHPFLRCAAQHGYLIETGFSYDMFLDPCFAKVKFRHSEDLCEKIFNLMEQGRQVYPEEHDMDCEAVARAIRSSKEYTRRAFQWAMAYLQLPSERETELSEKLSQLGYKQCDEIAWASPEVIDRINRAWKTAEYPVNGKFRFGFAL